MKMEELGTRDYFLVVCLALSFRRLANKPPDSTEVFISSNILKARNVHIVCSHGCRHNSALKTHRTQLFDNGLLHWTTHNIATNFPLRQQAGK